MPSRGRSYLTARWKFNRISLLLTLPGVFSAYI